MTILTSPLPHPRGLGLLDLHLDAALAEVDAIRHSRFDRRTDRLLVAFAEIRDGRERFDPLAELLPDLVPIGRLRAVTLHFRVCRPVHAGAARRRAVLATYATEVDLPGSGRVRFVPESVVDLRSARGPARLCPTLKRMALLLVQAMLDRTVDELVDAPALPPLLWGYAPSSPPRPEAGFEAEPWAALAETHEGLRCYPHELMARAAGEDDEPAQPPLQILADGRPLRGEAIRNPAGLALSRRGFDPFLGRTARDWQREARGPAGASLEKAALEVAAAAAGVDEPGTPTRLGALLDEVLAALMALGASSPAGLDDPAARAEADERLADPAGLVMAPRSPLVQAVRIRGGVPTPAACAFGTAHVQFDASDLGPHAPWYVPIRPRQSRRGGRPDRPSRLRDPRP